MQVSVQIDPGDEKRLMALLTETPDKIGREVEIAINKTAKKHPREIGKKVKEQLNIKVKDAAKYIKVTQKAKAFEKPAIVSVNKSGRPGLEFYGGRHTKKGVSYRIMKGGKKAMMLGAFMGPKPGVLAPKLYGGVFLRKNLADPRSKIKKLRGVSVWKYYLARGLLKWSEKTVQDRLVVEINNRIKAVLHRQSR